MKEMQTQYIQEIEAFKQRWALYQEEHPKVFQTNVGHEPSALLRMAFEDADVWQELLDSATEKEINLKIIKQLCDPENRKKLFQLIYENNYSIMPPHIAEIPKGTTKKVIMELNLKERKNRLIKQTKQLPTKYHLQIDYCKARAAEMGIDTQGFTAKDWKVLRKEFENDLPYQGVGAKNIVDSREWALDKINAISDEDGTNIVIWEEYFGIKNEPVAKYVPEVREVYVNVDLDRILLTLFNDCLFKLFAHKIHPQCKSYQKGIGTQKVVKEVSAAIVKLGKIIKSMGYKYDFSKYFDTVLIEVIDAVFDEIEKELGFEKDTEPVVNLLRRYYHQDLYFDKQGNLRAKYQSLKQGCAVASFLANVCLYELDDFMAKKYKIYYRYSDDLIVIDEKSQQATDDINRIIAKYGVKLNPKKVEPLYADKWFKFLGFKIKGDMITLSKERVDKFKKEVRRRSVDRRYCTAKKARIAINKFLYEGEYNFATSCLATMNVESDIQELNKFIMDCIRACGTGKKKVGGIGSVNHLSDGTILRGKGRHVRANREKTGRIENYLSMQCLANNIKISKAVFETTVRDMKG